MILPYPPSVNRYWRTFRGRMIISAHGRQYRADACAAVRAMGPRQPIEGSVAVTITMHAPDRRRRDVDNILKAVLDAMTHAGVWIDDSQIDDLRVVRGAVDPKNARVVVEFAELRP